MLVVAVGILAYHNSFTGPFIFDDTPSILENPTIRHLWPIWQTLSISHIRNTTFEGRPLINLSFAINYALGGYNVWGYHALNLAIHILAALTVLGIVHRTLLQPSLRERYGTAASELALAVAILWMVHPLQTEAVTYLSQRAESLMGLFYLLTMYYFIRGTASSSPWRWYGWCVTACALGMASKEVMVSAPLMVILYDRTFVSGSFREAWRARKQFYLALAVTWIPLVYLAASAGTHSGAAGFGGQMAWWQYAVTQSRAITHYLSLAVWPRPLVFDYGPILIASPGRLAPHILTIGLLVVGTGFSVRRWPALGFLGCWFFAILAPSSSVVPVMTQTMAEHRMYLSLLALVVLGVMGIHALVGRRTVSVALLLAIALGVLTWRRNQDYRSDVSIWNDTVAKWPLNPRGQYSLAIALGQVGKIEDAIGRYEEAIRLKPNYVEAHYNLGITLGKAGRLPEAIEHLQEALRIKPDYVEAHNSLATALEQAGRIPEAIEQLQLAIHINPEYAEAHYSLAIALWREGRTAEAIEHLEQAVRLKPDFAEAHYSLATALEQAGRIPEAIEHLQLAIHINPVYAAAHYSLAIDLGQEGRTAEAIEHLEQAVRLKPDFAEAHYSLAIDLGREGRITEAIEHLEQAVRLKPDFAEVHYSLAIALEQAGRIPEAIEHLQLAIHINPEYAEARAALTRMQVRP